MKGDPRIDEVAEAGREELLALWRRCFGTSAPARLSLGFLRQFIAFELQAKASGGLTATDRRKIGAAGAGTARAPAASLAQGGRLLREWNGVTHVVESTGDGWTWRGRPYRSLSAIAREITGAHWSGPRFFGLAALRGVGGRTRKANAGKAAAQSGTRP